MLKPWRQPLDYFLHGILAGDRVILAQAITLVESTVQEHQDRGTELLQALQAQQNSKPTIRIGITGAPGVGKSTFIDTLGTFLVNHHHKKVAVLAVDPSSSVTKGSILGDKTRMEKLSMLDGAFIRPSAAGATLGGVARKTQESILLVEAAGYDTILIETVGVGQSETAVRNMCDLFMLLLLPGAGDDLQGIKRGIVEMADILLITKADKDRQSLANSAQMYYNHALHTFAPKENSWSPKVMPCSALEHTGFERLWVSVNEYTEITKNNGHFDLNRQLQTKKWMHEALHDNIYRKLFGHPKAQLLLIEMETAVQNGTLTPFMAADRLLQAANAYIL